MESPTRHYVVKAAAAAAPDDGESPRGRCITCEGRELAAMPERDAAIALATKVARADAEEFGTETVVVVEDDGGSESHATFGTRTKLS